MSPGKLHVRSEGRGAAVILLHSSGSSGRQWSTLMDGLRDRYRLHAVDLPGHGSTPHGSTPEPATLAAHLRLLAPLLASSTRAHLVGHSFGGAVALALATRFADRVKSVVVYEPVLFRLLLDYHPRDRTTAEVMIAAASIRNWLQRGQSDRAARRFIDFWSGDGTWESLSETNRVTIAARMPAVAEHFSALFSDFRTHVELYGLPMPVLCLSGTRTRPATRRLAELLRHRMPQAVHESLCGLGHMGPVTHAQIFARRVAAFLERQESVAGNDRLALAAA